MFVGALLAATTGIVGATVIAMGLISLPAMLRNNYSKPLATGTICASGTLGQIIPPSVVLIILADQLANAADIASTSRKAEYREATGEITMPSEFDVVSASAGDMFMGAFIPGLILVGIYMIYILVQALVRPNTAPPVPYEGRYDWRFALRVLLALVPPLTLIFAVLGSIITGIATVNQAGAIGAIGALIMGGYRLTAGQRNAFVPAIIAVLSLAEILVVLTRYDINIKHITGAEDVQGIVLAAIGTAGLLVAILWSLWRSYRIEDTLKGVMVETAKTTSMVFIILLGAAMLTSAFRAFGGEELVREHLTSLPGGFWTQFVVVMAVIFFLGFFLDFIEIAVVVVPIVAPILLADPSANITAVWLGVMIGINIQTSFLTPPFGFALFYLRGVAPAIVKTLHIYRGAAVFIFLQLIGLAVAGAFPSLVNYLPNRVYLSSETAPPPMNPKLQHCLEGHVFAYYDENRGELRAAIDRAAGLDLGYLPAAVRDKLAASFDEARASIELAGQVRAADAAVEAYLPEYRPLHVDVRRSQKELRNLEDEIERLARDRSRLTRNELATDADIELVERQLGEAEARKAEVAEASRPPGAARGRATSRSRTCWRRPGAHTGRTPTAPTPRSRTSGRSSQTRRPSRGSARPSRPSSAWSRTKRRSRPWTPSSGTRASSARSRGAARSSRGSRRRGGRCGADRRTASRRRSSSPMRARSMPARSRGAPARPKICCPDSPSTRARSGTASDSGSRSA